MEEKWRKELKYTVTEGESIVTARRLSSFMQRDKNSKGRQGISDSLALF